MSQNFERKTKGEAWKVGKGKFQHLFDLFLRSPALFGCFRHCDCKYSGCFRWHPSPPLYELLPKVFQKLNLHMTIKSNQMWVPFRSVLSPTRARFEAYNRLLSALISARVHHTRKKTDPSIKGFPRVAADLRSFCGSSVCKNKSSLGSCEGDGRNQADSTCPSEDEQHELRELHKRRIQWLLPNIWFCHIVPGVCETERMEEKKL